MSELNPELKRLMHWARQVPGQAPGPMPLGFSSRVIAEWNSIPAESEFALWQKAIWGSAWAAGALILIELALLTAQQLHPTPSYDVTPAYQVVSTEFIP